MKQVKCRSLNDEALKQEMKEKSLGHKYYLSSPKHEDGVEGWDDEVEIKDLVELTTQYGELYVYDNSCDLLLHYYLQ
jgi:hypothetical protein